jgi:TRAP-type C4-dicarboxylate transport system permease large subunit
MIITLPVLLPIVKQLGMSPLHFGVIMTLNLNIGMVTPPVGVVIYLAAAIGSTTIEGSALATKWLLLSSIGVLLLVSYFPAISMFIPNLLGYT